MSRVKILKLHDKTLKELRKHINGNKNDTMFSYRSGPELVSFFNDLGFNDSYGQGFPSRWMYTDEKLSAINGTEKMEECIEKVFGVINFVGRFDELDGAIKHFNEYLAFNKWKMKRDNYEILFERLDKVTINKTNNNELSEESFLKQEFGAMNLDSLGLEDSITTILNSRLNEIRICLENNSPLGAIILSGSALKGILLGFASINPEKYRQAKKAPKNDFYKWSLNNFIEVSYEIGFLKEDVYKFSHVLRDFRNYIHPFKQMQNQFNPDKHTAKICWQVLQAAIYQLPKKF